MAKLSILAGSTSKLIDVFIQDTSVTTGAGLTGLTSGSSGLTWYYYREGAGASVSVAPQPMTLGTWTTRGFIVVDGTNMPGVYQLGVPDAAIAAGAKSVVMMLKGVTNMAPVVLEIELTAVDNQDATKFGLTNLDATVSSRLPTSSYTAPSNLTAAQIATGVWQDTTAGDFTVSASVGKSVMNGVSLGTGLTVATVAGAVGSVASGGIAAASFASGALDAVWSTAARTLTAGTNIQLPSNGLANVTSWTVAITGNITGNLSGSVGTVNSLATGTDSINTVATSGSTLTTGSAVSGTYASTAQQDGTYWQISDTTGTLDVYLEFDVGSVGVPTTAEWTGALTAAVNSLKVYAYNWAGTSWEQIGTIAGTSTLVTSVQAFDFTTSHAGTGGNLGLVRLRFSNTGLTAANFYIDRVICGYTSVYSFPTNFSALSITAGGHISNVDTLTTYTGNTVQTGDAYARLGAPAGASVSADVAAVKSDSTAIKTQTDKLAFTVSNQIDANVLDWKSATAPAMTGDAYARIGAAGAGLTALGDTRIAHLDADVSSRMATYTQPTGFLAATFPSTVASPTNITAGTVTTVTNLTNAPTSGDFTSTMKTSLNAATPAVTVSDKTGFSLASGGLSGISSWTVAITGNITGNLSGSVGSVTGLTASNLDAAISSRATAGSVWEALQADHPTAGTFGGITSDLSGIKSVTDNLPTFVHTAGKLWVLDGNGNPIAPASQTQAIQDKTDNLPSAPAATGDAMTLTSAYDAAKTAAQPSDIPSASAIGDNIAARTLMANIKKVNDVMVNGTGASADRWGP